MELKIDGLSKEALLDADKVNGGIWIHLDSAETDADGVPVPMYLNGDTSKPQRAKVRSQHCQAIKDADKLRQRKSFQKIRLATKKEKNDAIADSAIMSDAERFSYLLVALDNFGAEGGVQEVSQQDAQAIFDMTELATQVQQIRETAFEDKNYLATGDTPAGNGSASTPTTRKKP